MQQTAKTSPPTPQPSCTSRCRTDSLAPHAVQLLPCTHQPVETQVPSATLCFASCQLTPCLHLSLRSVPPPCPFPAPCGCCAASCLSCSYTHGWRRAMWDQGQAFIRSKIAIDLSHFRVLERIAASNRPAVVLEDDAQLDMVGTQWLPDLLTALQELPEVSSVRCAARRLSDRGEPSTGAQLGAACGLQRSNPTHRSMTAQHAAPGMLQMHMSPRGARIVCHTALNMLPGCAPCRDCCAPAGLGLNVP